jgi:hypothetical protein
LNDTQPIPSVGGYGIEPLKDRDGFALVKPDGSVLATGLLDMVRAARAALVARQPKERTERSH